MSTFTEDTASIPASGVPAPAAPGTMAAAATTTSQQIVESEMQTPWSQYLNSLNSQYQNKIRKAAQYSDYTLTLRYEDGREEKQVFTRKKLLQWQFDELEDLRAEASELAAANQSRKAQKALSSMYEKAATFMLWSKRNGAMMTVDEYKHTEFSEIRPALDASMLIGLISDPK